jgi:hypothetical protein
MDAFLQRVYVGEVRAQCNFGLNAVGSLNHALQQVGRALDLSPGQRNFFHSEVFRHTHSFLTHASNISRLFWPPSPRRRKGDSAEGHEARVASTALRAETLRSLFALGDDSALKDRTLRDHLEHYDERLDEWRHTSTHRNIASDTIGPKNSIVGLAETDMMRWFDPTTNVFRFRGEEYNLQQLAAAVDGLLALSAQLEDQLWHAQRGA